MHFSSIISTETERRQAGLGTRRQEPHGQQSAQRGGSYRGGPGQVAPVGNSGLPMGRYSPLRGCSDAPISPRWPQPKSLAAAPFAILQQTHTGAQESGTGGCRNSGRSLTRTWCGAIWRCQCPCAAWRHGRFPGQPSARRSAGSPGPRVQVWASWRWCEHLQGQVFEPTCSHTCGWQKCIATLR